MRKTFRLAAAWVACAVLVDGTLMTAAGQQAGLPNPPGNPLPPPNPGMACRAISSGPMHAVMNMPSQVGLGEEYTYEIAARATECVGNVIVTDILPDGASYVSSDPAAQISGDRLTWIVPSMDQGETKSFKVTARADREGRLISCATVTAEPRLCAATVVGKPVLVLDKSGPETALLNTEILYRILVSNQGNMTARNVVVTDTVPDGLAHASGQKQLQFQVGDLGPGQSRMIPVTVKATARGRVCNLAAAVSTNGGTVSDEACTAILQPGLKAAKTGDAEQYTGRLAHYTITVSNTGDTDLADVVVTDTAPAPARFISAEGASITGQRALWTIPTLKAGEQRTFTAGLTSAAAGNHCNRVVAAAGGLTSSAEACTLWKGQAAMLNEVVDYPDPIGVGVTTLFAIRITNQGTADDTNYRVVAVFEDEIDPASASNGGMISGKTVTWPVFPRLAPKQAFEYQVVGKAIQTGDHRLVINVISDTIRRGVIEEESTQVY